MADNRINTRDRLRSVGRTDILGKLDELDAIIEEVSAMPARYHKESSAGRAAYNLTAYQTGKEAERKAMTEGVMAEDMIEQLWRKRQETLRYTGGNPLKSKELSALDTAKLEGTARSKIEQMLQEDRSVFLPGEEGQPQVRLAEDLKSLQRAFQRAEATGQAFSEIWLENVDLSQMSQAGRLSTLRHARKIELSVEGLNQNKVQEILDEEFPLPQELNPENPNYDPQLAQLFAMAPADFELGWKALEKGKSPVYFDSEVPLMLEQINNVAAITPEQEQEPLSKESLAMLGSMALGMTGPGALVDVVSGIAGRDLIYESLSGEEMKLAWWERGLYAIPLIGKSISGIRRAGKLAQEGSLTARTSGELVRTLGKEVAKDFFVGDTKRVINAVKALKKAGPVGKIDDILRDIDTGIIHVPADEQALATILRTVNDNPNAFDNLGQEAYQIVDTGIKQIAKLANTTGDVKAKQYINALVVDALGKQGTAKTKAALKALGSTGDTKADYLLANTILRDARSAQDPRLSHIEFGKTLEYMKDQTQARKDWYETMMAAQAKKKAERAQIVQKESDKAERIKQAKEADLFEESTTKDVTAPNKGGKSITVEEAATEGAPTTVSPGARMKTADGGDAVIESVDTVADQTVLRLSNGETINLSVKKEVDKVEEGLSTATGKPQVINTKSTNLVDLIDEMEMKVYKPGKSDRINLRFAGRPDGNAAKLLKQAGFVWSKKMSGDGFSQWFAKKEAAEVIDNSLGHLVQSKNKRLTIEDAFGISPEELDLTVAYIRELNDDFLTIAQNFSSKTSDGDTMAAIWSAKNMSGIDIEEANDILRDLGYPYTIQDLEMKVKPQNKPAPPKTIRRTKETKSKLEIIDQAIAESDDPEVIQNLVDRRNDLLKEK